MKATTANAAIRIRLLVLSLSIHSLVFMTLHYYIGETCHFQFQGPERVPPPQARFSGKIPEPREDDFSRNLKGPTLPSERGVCQLCPVVLRSVNGCICFSVRVLVVVILRFGIQKELPGRTAPFCKDLQKSVWYIRFISRYCQKTR